MQVAQNATNHSNYTITDFGFSYFLLQVARGIQTKRYGPAITEFFDSEVSNRKVAKLQPQGNAIMTDELIVMPIPKGAQDVLRGASHVFATLKRLERQPLR